MAIVISTAHYASGEHLADRHGLGHFPHCIDAGGSGLTRERGVQFNPRTPRFRGGLLMAAYMSHDVDALQARLRQPEPRAHKNNSTERRYEAMTAHDDDKESLNTKPRFARRRMLQGIGVGGLAAAASVFGFARPAYANPAYAVGCCNVSCPKGFGISLQQCETGNYYVWTCKMPGGAECYCCEHGQPGKNGCNGTTAYSVVSCNN